MSTINLELCHPLVLVYQVYEFQDADFTGVKVDMRYDASKISSYIKQIKLSQDGRVDNFWVGKVSVGVSWMGVWSNRRPVYHLRSGSLDELSTFVHAFLDVYERIPALSRISEKLIEVW